MSGKNYYHYKEKKLPFNLVFEKKEKDEQKARLFGYIMW